LLQVRIHRKNAISSSDLSNKNLTCHIKIWSQTAWVEKKLDILKTWDHNREFKNKVTKIVIYKIE